MVRLDHIAIPVRDVARSRDWYTRFLGMSVEFEVHDRKTVALRDTGDMTLFVYEQPGGKVAASCTLTFQVDDVDAKYRDLYARGVGFDKPPQRLFWGYGAELRDPDGYLIYLWDQASMREKGGG